jgi:enoyl-CoA hydratase/carnithine racemase
MHHADGGITRLVNVCGVGFAMELLLTGAPVNAARAYTAGMVSQVVAPEGLMSAARAVVDNILQCDQAALESAKETILEIVGRPFYDQLRVEAMWGYALCGGNPTIGEKTKAFFEKS